MAILKSGDQVRLSGNDAADYKRDTGRTTLPKTVAEHNRALDDSAAAWRATDCPEGDLLGVINEDSKI